MPFVSAFSFMILSVQSVLGQSIYDVCLQVYGSLDRLIKLCTDNAITNLDSFPVSKIFFYDTDLITNSNATGTQYATDALATNGDGGRVYGNEYSLVYG